MLFCEKLTNTAQVLFIFFDVRRVSAIFVDNQLGSRDEARDFL